jgi:hypothetical protein
VAFPSVAATNSGNQAATTTPTVNLPANISAGDLLLVSFYNNTGATVTITGYTELFTQTFDTDRWTVLARDADGTEGATVGATLSASNTSAHATCRITGWYGTITGGVNWGTAATGGSTTPNPPSLDPPDWATEDTLWIAGYCWSSNVSHSAYPANYTLGQVTDRHAASSGGGVALAGRENAVASEDPGTGTLSLSAQWAANTLAIRPAAGGDVLIQGLHGIHRGIGTVTAARLGGVLEY